MLKVSGPVSAGDVLHALATSPAGTRPRPLRDGSAEMLSVPVVVALRVNGRVLELRPCGFTLSEHVQANSDPEIPLPVGPEQLPALVFHVRLPAGCRLVCEGDDAPPEVVPPEFAPEPVTEGPREIPEFLGVDPGIFAVNPEAVNAGLRAVFAKGKTNEGASA